MTDGGRRGDVRGVAPWIAFGALALYTLQRVDRYWLPEDEGMLGESALRVLRGQLPHRDFDAIYTGGLELMHALAMGLAGVDVLHLRWVLWLWFCLWMVAVYRILRRVRDPLESSLLGAAVAILTIPQFPQALPSWYNLFFATFGLLALLRYGEGRGWGWLVVAGAWGGLSIAFKITGLYYVAAAFFGIVFLGARGDGLEAEPTLGQVDGRGWGGVVAAVLGLGVFMVLLLSLLASWDLSVSSAVLFVLPPLAMFGAVTLVVARRGHPGLGGLVASVAPFLMGVMVPLLVLALPYLLTGAWGALVEGVLVRPLERLETTVRPPPELAALAAGAAFVAPLVLPVFHTSRTRWWSAAGVLAALGALVLAGGGGGLARTAVLGGRMLVPLVCVLVAYRLVRAGPEGVDRSVVLLALGAAAVNLVQIPYAAETYVFFVWPLALMAAFLHEGEAAGGRGVGGRPIRALYAVVFIVYGLVNSHHFLAESVEPLGLDGASLRVRAEEAERYRRLVALVDSVDPGPAIFATSDAPQVYFLTGRRNPTRTIYDFLDRDYRDPEARTDRIGGQLEDAEVGLVVLRDSRYFSRPPPEALSHLLRSRYPCSRTWDDLEVRWSRSAVEAGRAVACEEER